MDNLDIDQLLSCCCCCNRLAEPLDIGHPLSQHTLVEVEDGLDMTQLVHEEGIDLGIDLQIGLERSYPLLLAHHFLDRVLDVNNILSGISEKKTE